MLLIVHTYGHDRPCIIPFPYHIVNFLCLYVLPATAQPRLHAFVSESSPPPAPRAYYYKNLNGDNQKGLVEAGM
jgi:hypothetical protein